MACFSSSALVEMQWLSCVHCVEGKDTAATYCTAMVEGDRACAALRKVTDKCDKYWFGDAKKYRYLPSSVVDLASVHKLSRRILLKEKCK